MKKSQRIPWNKTNTTTTCTFCKKIFSISPSRIKGGQGKYCMKSCQASAQRGKIPPGVTPFKGGHTPWHKGLKGLTLNSGKTHFPRGHMPWTKGKKFAYSPHPNRRGKVVGPQNNFWKGGITPINLSLRTSSEYREWRNKIFERDNYTRMKCFQKTSVSGKLNADHLKPFSIYPELRFDVNNGQTLCIPCHKEKTKQDWKEYNYYHSFM